MFHVVALDVEEGGMRGGEWVSRERSGVAGEGGGWWEREGREGREGRGDGDGDARWASSRDGTRMDGCECGCISRTVR